MAHIYHGITGWTRVGNAVFFEDSSGLKTAQINYQCAGITTTPPFVEGQSVNAPYNEYVVYPNPSISIGKDGISSCLIQAYSVNTALKQDEPRKVLNQISGTWVDTSITNSPRDLPMWVNVLGIGAYVKDAQFTNNQSTPTSAITYSYEIISARVGPRAVVTNGLSIYGTYDLVSLNQEYKGSVVVTEAIYASNIVFAFTAGPVIYL